MSPSHTPTPTPTPRRYVLSFHIFLHHTFNFFTFPTRHLYHRIYISSTLSPSLSLSLSHRHTTRTFSFLSISNTASHFIDHAPESRLYLTFTFPSFQTSLFLPFFFFLYQQVIYHLVIRIYFFSLSRATHVIFWYQQHWLPTTPSTQFVSCQIKFCLGKNLKFTSNF